MSDFEFVTAFYKWEAKWREKQGFTIELVKNGQADNFIIWRILSKGNDNTILYGTKNGTVYNLTIANTKLSNAYKNDFLEKLFLSK
ncbi:MAG: hypothetical protein H0W73_03450 [Bacteroidetes bacterium]|nr:hypothetical protein [Bacteroidota bacterium]